MNSLKGFWRRLTSAAESRSADRKRARKEREELVTVERARLRKQTALLRLSSELAAAVDEEQIHWRVVTGLHDELGYDVVALLMLDVETGDRIHVAGFGYDDPVRRIPVGRGLSQRPLETGELQYTPDVWKDPRFSYGAGGSEVDVPVRIGGEVLGVLVAESKEIDAFDKDDFKVLTAAAQQAGVAIDKARLLAAEQRRADELKALHHTLSDITAELELPSLLQIIVERAAALLHSTGGELGLIDEEKQEIHIVVSYNLGEDFVGSRHDVGEGIMGMVASAKEPMIVDDYQTWEKGLSSYSHIHATVAAPLKVGGRLIGVFTTATIDPERKFDESDMHLLTMFARQAAIAIENARLFDQAQREIGERRKIEEEIRHQKEYYESLLVNNPVAVVTADLVGTIVSWNPMAEVLFGYTQEEVIGQNLDDIVAKDSPFRSEAIGYTKEVIEVGRVYTTTQRVRKDGSLVDVELLALPVIVGGKEVGFIAIYHDISERVRIEEELRQSKEDAEAASQAKSTFLANMSHELRTPLNAIIGFTRLVKRRSGDVLPQKQADNLDKVLGSADHLLELINSVLDLSKIEAGRVDIQPTMFGIETLVEACLETVRPLAKSHHLQLNMEFESGLPHLHTDQDKVRQILINLLGNAIKFTKQGAITVSAGRNEDNLMLAVADTGIGIPEDDLERIFEEFQQVDTSTTRKHGGTGLGLSISRHLAHLLNGEISVESTVGVGSTFTLVIPLRFSGPEVAATPDTREDAVAASEEHLPLVLAIDDDPNTIDLLRENLSEAGYRVSKAYSGKEGLDKARSLQPNVIILDILFPRESGWEILSELKTDPITREIPVIVLSVVDDKKRGYRLGAYDYLVKPFDRDNLMRVLEGITELDRQPISLLAVDDDPKIIDLIGQLLEDEPYQITSAENGTLALKAISRSQPDIILLDLLMPEMDGFAVIEHLRHDEELHTIPILVLTAKDLTEDEETWLNERAASVSKKQGLTTEQLLQDLRGALRTYHLGRNEQ
jgi:PAS domain S-box-containing protein